jgi:cysteine desulfurase
MIYLDYSATTKCSKEVLKTFVDTNEKYFANPNSLHKLGIEVKNLSDAATTQIANLLHVKKEEIIYTSCSSESNNLAIKGVALRNQKKGRHIITTNLEHSSIDKPLDYLKTLGFEIDIVKTNNGLVDLEDLKKLIKKDTILVTISAVNSETGIKQNIEEIGQILKNYNCYFHVDATQSIGKVNIDFKDVDLISFSAHKFYGLKGIACLIKKEHVLMEPLIHGGKSTTNYRSGTPAVPLIVSMSKALRIALENLDQDYQYVETLNNYLKDNLKKLDNVIINSNKYSIPHILNVSVIDIKPETMQHALEEYDIYISTQSACSSNKKVSKAVFEVTNDEKLSEHSIRISLSKFTTKEEIDEFIECFKICLDKLKIR